MRIKAYTLFTTCSLLALLAGACASSNGEQPVTDVSSPEAIARQAVAERVGDDLSETSVISSKAVEYSDASLGCPQRNMNYAQVITSGYQVFVRYQDREFDVRVAGKFAQICAKGGRQPQPAEDRSR